MPHWPVSPTDSDLQAAWQRRRTDGWPPTYAASMADDLYRVIVRAEAIRHLLALRMAARPAAAAVPAVGAPNLAPVLPTAVDRKRAAAGDRDD